MLRYLGGGRHHHHRSSKSRHSKQRPADGVTDDTVSADDATANDLASDLSGMMGPSSDYSPSGAAGVTPLEFPTRDAVKSAPGGKWAASAAQRAELGGAVMSFSGDNDDDNDDDDNEGDHNERRRGLSGGLSAAPSSPPHQRWGLSSANSDIELDALSKKGRHFGGRAMAGDRALVRSASSDVRVGPSRLYLDSRQSQNAGDDGSDGVAPTVVSEDDGTRSVTNKKKKKRGVFGLKVPKAITHPGGGGRHNSSSRRKNEGGAAEEDDADPSQQPSVAGTAAAAPLEEVLSVEEMRARIRRLTGQLEETQSYLEAKTFTLDQLQKARDDDEAVARRRVQQLEEQLRVACDGQAAATQLVKVQAELETTTARLLDSESEAKTLQHLLKETKDTLAQSQLELRAAQKMQQDSGVREAELKVQLRAAESQSTAQRARLSVCEAQVEDLEAFKTEVASLKNSLDAEQRANAALQTENNFLKTEKTKSKALTAKLQQELRDGEAHLQEMLAKNGETAKILRTRESELAAARNEAAALTAQLSVLEATQSNLQLARSDLANTRDDVVQTKTQLARMEAEVEKLRVSKAEADKALVRLRTELDSSENALKTRQKQENLLQQTIAEREAELSQARNQIKRFELQLDDAGHTRRDYEQLQIDFESTKRELASAQATLENVRADVTRAERETERARNAQLQAERETATARAEVKAAETKLNAAESRSTTLEQTHKTREELLQAADHRVAALEEQMAAQSQQIAELEQGKIDLIAQLEDLMGQQQPAAPPTMPMDQQQASPPVPHPRVAGSSATLLCNVLFNGAFPNSLVHRGKQCRIATVWRDRLMDALFDSKMPLSAGVKGDSATTTPTLASDTASSLISSLKLPSEREESVARVLARVDRLWHFSEDMRLALVQQDPSLSLRYQRERASIRDWRDTLLALQTATSRLTERCSELEINAERNTKVAQVLRSQMTSDRERAKAAVSTLRKRIAQLQEKLKDQLAANFHQQHLAGHNGAAHTTSTAILPFTPPAGPWPSPAARLTYKPPGSIPPTAFFAAGGTTLKL